MLGPLFAIALLRIAGVHLEVPRGGRQAGQWAIGTTLGLYFTPPVLAELGRNSDVILLMAGGAVAIGLLGSLVIERWARVSPATAFFSALPGGASEMVVLAERQGGATERVAAAHALRVTMVVAIIPFLLLHWSGTGDDAFREGARDLDWTRLPLVIAAALAGAALFLALRIANAWILGPLACVGALSALDLPLSSLPTWLVNGGQLLLGAALGCRFSPEFFGAAPRFLSVAAIYT
jgi:membrane AbrB-like protein